jgi:hypothetical protein
MKDELQTFLNFWDAEAEKSVAVMRALPADGYDFRPDPAGRSLGELAWHLAEVDGYTTYGIEQGTFTFSVRPPGIERPKSLEALAPALRTSSCGGCATDSPLGSSGSGS